MTHFSSNSSHTSAVAYIKPASCQVIQQSLGQQVSMPVAQIVAGFTKVFVGEIVEKGESRPLAMCQIVLLPFVLQREPSKLVVERKGL